MNQMYENRMNRMTVCLALVVALVLACAIDVAAAVPQLINYQGRLTSSVGAPLDTTVALVFQIYADSNGVTSLWDETHPSVVIADGLFQVQLGSVSPIAQSVFSSEKRWLGVRLSGGPATTLIPIVSTAYAYRSNVTDTAAIAKTVSDNSITTAKIQNGTISFADIGQNSATANEVIKWNGSAWEAQADATGSNASGWVDNGTVIGLLTATDTVSLNSALRLGKLNVGGNMSLTAQSSIYWGTDSTFIKGFSGGDMTLQGEDIFAKTTGSIYFADVDAGNFVEIDNANELVGVGTTAPDEKLQVENDAASGRAFLQLETSHATNFGETGIRFKTPQNTWHLRMDDYTNNNLLNGALGLRSQVGIEAMTWLEGGNVGVGTTNPLRKLQVNGSALVTDSLGVGTTSPTKKLHVFGSALIKDTLYAGAIDPSLMAASRLPDESGVAGSSGGNKNLTGDWIVLDSVIINAPAPGYVLALATVSFYVNHSYGKYCSIIFGISTSSAADPSVYYHWTYDETSSSGTLDNPASCHRLFTVSSAGEHRYYFMVQGTFMQEDIRAERPALAAVYFPTSSYYGTGKGIALEPQVEPRASDAEDRVKSERSKNDKQPDVVSELRALREEVETLKKRLDEQNK
jgi:hypothetical protein